MASKLAKEHVEQYYPYRDYDEEAFAIRTSFPLDSIVEVTREQLLNSKEKSLRRSGIYLIVHENGETVYVGLAADFHSRFTKGMRNHSKECEPGCGHWGHFADPTPGAAMAGLPYGECRFFILEGIEYDGFRISQAEIDWYYIFIANGWSGERLAESITKKLTNQRGSLGSKGREASPTIIFSLSANDYYYFPSTQDASDFFDVPNGVLFGSQRQNSGLIRRSASPAELETGGVIGESQVVWKSSNGDVITVDRANRNSGMEWISGPLGHDDIEILRKFSDKSDYRKRPSSKFNGVHIHVDDKWRWKANRRELKISGKRKEKWKYGFSTPRKAAINRECWVIKNNLTDINDSNFDWKPPTD